MAEGSYQMTPAPSHERQNSLLTPRLSEDKKKELRELNARLENYARKVREIYQSNLDLQSELKGAKNFNMNDLDRRYYEDKMAQARRALEDAKKEKERIISEIAKKDEEINSHLNHLKTYNNKAKDEEAKRVSIEKSLESINEKIKSSEELLAKEKEKFTKRLREFDTSSLSLSSRISEEFEKLLNEEKQFLKAALDKDKEDLRIHYEQQVSELEDKSQESDVELTNKKIEVAALKDDLVKAMGENRRLINEGKEKDTQIGRAQEQSSSIVDHLGKAISNKQDEIDRLNRILSDKTYEIQTLISMNAALESEIKTVQRLLEREETVLGISGSYFDEEYRNKRIKIDSGEFQEPSPQTNNQVALPSQDFSYSSDTSNDRPLSPVVIKTGSVIIEEINFEEEYLRISNVSDREILLDDWWIQAGGPQTLPKRYDFSPNTTIKPGDHYDVQVLFSDEDRKLDQVLSFNSNMTKPGAYIQIFNHEDHLISHVELREEISAQGEKLGQRLCCLQ